MGWTISSASFALQRFRFPWQDAGIDIIWFNAELLHQRGRKRSPKQLCMHSGKLLTLRHLWKCNQWAGYQRKPLSNSHDTISSMRRDDGIYIKVASVIGSVSTEGQTTWYRKWFNVTSAKHRRATEAASVFSAVWCLKLKVSSATFLLSFLVSLINLKQSSAPLLCFWTRSTLFRQTPCLHN